MPQLSSKKLSRALVLVSAAFMLAWILFFAVYRGEPSRHWLKYEGAYYIYNNSIGNEWVHELSVNGQPLEQEHEYPIDIAATFLLKMTAKSTEIDKIPDVGIASIDVPVKNLMQEPVTPNVRVRENRVFTANRNAEIGGRNITTE